MAPASTLSARPQGAPARQAVQRAVRTYSFGFAAVLAIGMLVANIATVHGGFGVADQLANVAPMAIAALASAPSIIAGGFDISISPLIVLTNAVYIVWLAPNGLGGAVSVPIILGLGLAVGVLNGLLIIVLRVQAIVVTLAMFFSLQGVVLFVAPNPLDDTSLAYLNDPAQRAEIARRGEDAEHQHETYIRSINRALRDKPAGMTVTTHMCRGNFRSSWVAQGGYDFVADALFNQPTVDGYFMEFDDERSGGFAPLRFVPTGKYVVLGLVTSKKGELEAKDDIKRRIEEASKFVDIDQLCLSPQCGFSSTLDGNSLSRDEQIAKLRLVAETAEEVWGTQ